MSRNFPPSPSHTHTHIYVYVSLCVCECGWVYTEGVCVKEILTCQSGDFPVPLM